jgi:hypothetical protein
MQAGQPGNTIIFLAEHESFSTQFSLYQVRDIPVATPGTAIKLLPSPFESERLTQFLGGYP